MGDLPAFLRPGDLIVVNRSRVLPCRLIGKKAGTGGRVELLLLHPLAGNTWEALVGGRYIRPGQLVDIAPGVVAEVGEEADGGRAVRFPDVESVLDVLHRFGRAPLPPYISNYAGDPQRYQTVYADVDGSAAAPTAGLHFTPALIERLRGAGVEWASIVLHVGLDTFRPITDQDVRQHRIHTEWIDVPRETVDAIRRTRAQAGRVLAVGTTTVRALEHAAADGTPRAYSGPADLFIVPGYRFRAIDGLLTNFHLPRSSLLLLVSAFVGRDRLLQAYAEAARLRYRFYSFGDAMLIL